MKRKGFGSWLPASKKELAKSYTSLSGKIERLDTRTKATAVGLGLTSLVVLGQIAAGMLHNRHGDKPCDDEDNYEEFDGNFLEFEDESSNEPSEDVDGEKGGEN